MKTVSRGTGTAAGRIRLFGALLDPLTLEETIRRIEARIDSGTPTQHVVVNVAKLVSMQRDTALRDAVNGCDIINADGQGVVWAARLLGVPMPGRVPGIDLFLALVARAETRRHPIYLLGATQAVVERTAAVLRERHPRLVIAGYRHGYFPPEVEPTVAREIAQSRPAMLFVAMTSPRKELFISRYRGILNVPFTMGVGGSFDVVAGLSRRAPAWMQAAGMEWVFRLWQEPGRLGKRYLTTNAALLWMMMKAFALGRKGYAHGE